MSKKTGFNVALLVRLIVGLVVATAAIALVQLWFTPFATDIFWKLLVTCVVVGLVLSFIIAVKSDLGSEKSMRDDKYLD